METFDRHKVPHKRANMKDGCTYDNEKKYTGGR